MKVKANKSFERITDLTIGRPRKDGEIFEVDESRAKVLLDRNLVSVVEEKEEVKEKAKEDKKTAKKPVKKPRAKK